MLEKNGETSNSRIKDFSKEKKNHKTLACEIRELNSHTFVLGNKNVQPTYIHSY